MDLTTGALVAAVAATLVGASIQASIGFGMNLVVVPVLALASPASLPAAAVLLGLPMSVAMVRHERHAVDRAGLVWILVGRLPGTLLGTWVVAAFTPDALKALIGVFVILAVGLSITAPPLRLSARNQVAAGAVSGTTGTAAGIGGPPLALLYQHATGPTMRATLAASFLFGTVLSIASLAVAGEIRAVDVGLAAVLIPVVVAGSWIGRQAHAVLDGAWLRPVVLGFAVVSGAVVIADAIW